MRTDEIRAKTRDTVKATKEMYENAKVLDKKSKGYAPYFIISVIFSIMIAMSEINGTVWGMNKPQLILFPFVLSFFTWLIFGRK